MVRFRLFQRVVLCGLALCALSGAPQYAEGQEPTDSLRLEVQRLAALIDSLGQEIERLQSEGQEEAATDALADLRAAAAAAVAAGGVPAPTSEPQEFVGRQRALQSLNPEISVNADVYAHIDGEDRDADNFFPREFEISIKSALDPFSRAAIFLSQEVPGGEIEPFAEGGEEEEEGGGFGVEEGYVEWVSLPGGLGVKFGRFFQRFGTINRWHTHALPFQSRSLPHLAFLGEESLAQSGVSVSWLAPFGGGGRGTYEATVEVTRSGNESLYGESSGPSFLGHVNAFWTLNRSTDLDLALSWIGGDFENETESFSRNAYTAEVALNWAPPERSRQTGLMVRGGYMLLDGLNAPEIAPPVGTEAPGTASGFWSMAELRLSFQWLVGARFDRVENPAAPDVTQWLASPTLTWWQSEFVRIRAEYDFLSGLEGGDGSGRFLLRATFAMGPHKHATY